MIHEIIKLKDVSSLKTEGYIETFIHGNVEGLKPYQHDLPAVIICPGGGYVFVSAREGEPIAIDFYNRNYNAFVLWYSVAPNRYPTQLTELAVAVDYIKKNAKAFNTDGEKLFGLGFSAGAHLIASLSNLWKNLPKDLLGEKYPDAKLTGIAIGYPVISYDSDPESFVGALLEKEEDKLKYPFLSLDTSVNKDNFPTFIWTTREDTDVTPVTSYDYGLKLLENGVKHELHLFPYGDHGGATCDSRTLFKDNKTLDRARIWLDMCNEFFKSL